MSAASVTTRGRRAAERLMVDRCEITRKGDPVTDPDTGVVTVPTITAYSGRCKLQSQRPWPSNPDAGGHVWTVVPFELHVPVSGTDGIRVGDVVEITGSFDPANVGRRLRVEAGDRKTYQTAVRLLVKEVTG